MWSFAGFTQHVWEDFYITYRVSRNLVEGHGLVYQLGERVHTFTSPLGVLLPALTRWITGSDAGALLWFQVISTGAFAGAVVLVWVVCHQVWRLPVWVSVPGVLLLATDAKAVDFAVNGMETAWMLLFLASFIYALQQRGHRRREWVAVGLGAAALQWTRPDAFVVGGAVALGFWLFAPGTLPTGRRSGGLQSLIRAFALAVVLYLPWLLWAWYFYGTPIPNTVTAKAQALSGWAFESWHEWLRLPWLRGLGAAPLPIYPHMGGWPAGPILIGYYTACVLGHWWLLPWADPRGRACSFAAFGFGLYLSQINLYPWYLPPATLLLILTLAFALTDLNRWLRRIANASWIAPVGIATGLAVLQVMLLFNTARQVKIQQALIEGQRRKIGLELKANAQPTDRVFLECVGYIGFYSGLKLLDYPGLTAPEVVRARREIADDWGALVRHFKPEWLVLRPAEVFKVSSRHYPEFQDEYYVAGVFSQEKALDEMSALPGLAYLRYDQTFYVLHRH